MLLLNSYGNIIKQILDDYSGYNKVLYNIILNIQIFINTSD